MTYATIYAAANDVNFQGRCLVATWVAANDIVNEDPETEDHVARLDWANRVLRDRTNLTPRQLAVQVLRNPVIAADPAAAVDTDIQYQIGQVLATLVAVG